MKEYFEKLGKECFDKLIELNPKGGIKEFIRIAVEFGYNKSELKWIDVKERKPIAYKTGHWDGKNSDQVLVEDKKGNRYLAHYCEGFIDGLKFEDWYDCRDFLIDTEVVKYLEIPE